MDEQAQSAHDITRKNEEPQSSNRDKTGQGQGDAVVPTQGSREGKEESAGEEPSGYRGENPSTAGSGSTAIHSATPENATGKIDPSAPGSTGITPNTTAE